MKKLWGKGGSNIGKIVTKTITGEKLSEHEKLHCVILEQKSFQLIRS